MSGKEFTVQWRPGGVLEEHWRISVTPFPTKRQALEVLRILRRDEDSRFYDYRVVKRKVSEWVELPY